MVINLHCNLICSKNIKVKCCKSFFREAPKFSFAQGPSELNSALIVHIYCIPNSYYVHIYVLCDIFIFIIVTQQRIGNIALSVYSVFIFLIALTNIF